MRQVSFTLLMTRRCDSNPAQYERNRRFGHLVHALGRAAGGAKLPSVGLCLNASKAVSFLVKGGNDISRSLVSRKAQNNVSLLGDRSLWSVIARALFAVWSRGPLTGSHRMTAWLLTVDHGYTKFDVETRNRLYTT